MVAVCLHKSQLADSCTTIVDLSVWNVSSKCQSTFSIAKFVEIHLFTCINAKKKKAPTAARCDTIWLFGFCIRFHCAGPTVQVFDANDSTAVRNHLIIIAPTTQSITTMSCQSKIVRGDNTWWSPRRLYILKSMAATMQPSTTCSAGTRIWTICVRWRCHFRAWNQWIRWTL